MVEEEVCLFTLSWDDVVWDGEDEDDEEAEKLSSKLPAAGGVTGGTIDMRSEG